MANAYKKHPSSKLGGLKLTEWNSNCVKFFFLIFLPWWIISVTVTGDPNGFAVPFTFTSTISIIMSLIGWFISQMQSDHYLCLQEDNIIGKASNGREFDLAYTEIRSVQVKDFDDYNFLVRILGRFIPFIRYRETLIIRHSGGIIKYVYERNAKSIANDIEHVIKEINRRNQRQNQQQNTNQNNQQNTYQNNQQNTHHNNQQNPPSASGIRR